MILSPEGKDLSVKRDMQIGEGPMRKYIIAIFMGWYLMGGLPSQLSAAEKGTKCGGIAGKGCEERGEYCKYEVGECRRGVEGVCARRPEICTQNYAPVCGCDDKTYSNACQALRAGVSVARLGGCTTSQ